MFRTPRKQYMRYTELGSPVLRRNVVLRIPGGEVVYCGDFLNRLRSVRVQGSKIRNESRLLGLLKFLTVLPRLIPASLLAFPFVSVFLIRVLFLLLILLLS
ncbi:hypothetical protein NE237_029932 [Protea cynaroides]|uniref:Uncharacterized protein n=1 Tax=Protea cynaroides TaxID=273540 RepID=A0A9Q0GT80_9MAGN|nr:hypothetical protein NE237_029932 [Protea cynaroides]